MTEKEFLEKRIPIWLEGEDLHVSMPTGSDRHDFHAYLSKKYGYNALFAIRGYYWPKSHVQLYIGEYETPNCTILVSNYLFQYFPDIKYVGFGCHIGKVGEIWKPKVWIVRDSSCISSKVLENINYE